MANAANRRKHLVESLLTPARDKSVIIMAGTVGAGRQVQQ